MRHSATKHVSSASIERTTVRRMFAHLLHGHDRSNTYCRCMGPYRRWLQKRRTSPVLHSDMHFEMSKLVIILAQTYMSWIAVPSGRDIKRSAAWRSCAHLLHGQLDLNAILVHDVQITAVSCCAITAIVDCTSCALICAGTHSMADFGRIQVNLGMSNFSRH